MLFTGLLFDQQSAVERLRLLRKIFNAWKYFGSLLTILTTLKPVKMLEVD